MRYRAATARSLPSGVRRLVLASGTWHFRVTGQSAILFSPERDRKGDPYDKWVVDLSTLTGRDWNTLERGQWKRTSDGMVTPGVVREFIEGQILAERA